MIKIVNLEVLKEVVCSLIDCDYNVTVKIIPHEFFRCEFDHYEIEIENVKL